MDECQHLLLFFIILSVWETGSDQVHYSVPEEAKHGTFVGRIAQDLGLELTELVPRLFRVTSKSRGDLLEVNLQNGILFVNSRIDREELCGRSLECSIHLEVIVDRPLQVFHVEVEVKDINDNPPVFPGAQKNLFVAESRPLDSRFPLEGASDADIGENALLTYRLSSNDYFSLDVPTADQQVKPLALVLRKPLDREDSPELHLVLTATDRGKPELTGTVQLLVKVLDANDNAPAFDRTLCAVKLPENVPNGTLVIKLNASDLDEGLNGDFMYSFSSDVSPDIKSKFYIDPLSGEITVIGHIDFEESKAYKIRVEATDKGLPPLAGHCTVLVEVVDANDNAPELTITSLSLPISENAQPGTVIALINVFDRDSGANGQVTCSLTSQVPFKLVSTFKNYYSLVLDSALDRESVANYDTGEVRVNDAIDFEDSNTYEIHVDVTDKGNPPMVGHCTVLVEILDENDNSPEVIITSLALPVLEDSQVGTTIALISVSDRDSGANGDVTCSLMPQSPFMLVSTFKNYYSLVLDSTLDRESVANYELVVTARDGGSPSLSATASVSVEVADVNDNAPLFAQPEYTVFVKENNAPGCHIFTVSARDADAQENARVSYALVERRVGERALGEIKVNGKIDFEETKSWKLQIEAVDKGTPPMFGHCTVLVEVLDVNDNAPELLVTSLLLSIPEDAPLGTVIALVRVTDRDAGENAQVTCSLTLQVPFKLVSTFKNYYSLVLDSVLDREKVSKYALVLMARDSGSPSLSATASVSVDVDSGQAPKTFSRASVSAAGAETALVDVNVYLIIAICAVSSLLVLTLLLYTALRCSGPPSEGACVPGKPRLVCSSAEGSWSCSQQRRQRVCSGEGPPKADLMVFSPSVPSGSNSGDTGDQPEFCENVSTIILGCFMPLHVNHVVVHQQITVSPLL
uniref:Cadherin domain-containing protein n=1 Tax=Catagonus wagneri TaxID=51154 RepID=A0A8C3WCJ8_9CETA